MLGTSAGLECSGRAWGEYKKKKKKKENINLLKIMITNQKNAFRIYEEKSTDKSEPLHAKHPDA